MSPNMMLARTEALPIRLRGLFLLHISSRSSVGRLAHPGHVATYVPGDLLRAALLQRTILEKRCYTRRSFDNPSRFTRNQHHAREAG